MSNQFPSPIQYDSPMPVAVPPKPSKLKRFGMPVGLLLLGLLFGGAVGASAVPKPEIQVQEKIVEKRVEVPTTPASCLTAIQHAESIFGVSAEVTSIMSDAIRSAARLDAAGVNAATVRIKEQNSILDGYVPKWNAARDSCKASR